MSRSVNKAVVRRFIVEGWNAEDTSAVDALVHEDYGIPGAGRGPEAVKHNMAIYRAAFPDLEWTIEEMITEGEWVAVRLMLNGTHQGEFRGIPATGKRIAMQEMVFWRIVDGKLHTIHAQAETLGLRIQLGAIPPTAWNQPVTAPPSSPDGMEATSTDA